MIKIATAYVSALHLDLRVKCMGGGTIFKVGGTTARQKTIENFVVWIGNCDVTIIETWRH